MISTNQSVLHFRVPVNVSEVVSGGHYEVNNNVISTQQYLHNNIYTTISTVTAQPRAPGDNNKRVLGDESPPEFVNLVIFSVRVFVAVGKQSLRRPASREA